MWELQNIKGKRSNRVVRLDMGGMYFFQEYDKTVYYGNQNLNIRGVREQLQDLEEEKNKYFEAVENIISAEKDSEQLKYQQYEKWSKIEKRFKWIAIALMPVFIVSLKLSDFFSSRIRISVIFTLLNASLILLSLLGLLAALAVFIVAKIGRYVHGRRYSQYIEAIALELKGLGDSFDQKSRTCYDAIDNLYLRSLDPAHRELVLLRRQQEKHNEDMLRLERERMEIEEKNLREQQRSRRAQEELLSIEKEREKRYRGW